MSLQIIQQGIAAVQGGQLQEGARLLQQGLADPSLPATWRAAAQMWLAETSPDVAFKIQCYRAAAQADPQNEDIQQRLQSLTAAQNPPMPPPPQSQQDTPPATLPGMVSAPAVQQQPPQILEFGVQGGANGIGTAFLVVRKGLLATTRFMVGSQKHVDLIQHRGKRVEGRVVRSYPEYDLAFIQADVLAPHVHDMTPEPDVPPETELIVDDYTGGRIRATRRSTKRSIAPGWFPTTFKDDVPRSFIGAPIVDEQDDLVGMLTINADRNSRNVYGLHASLIRRKIEEYYAELQYDPDRIYCGCCGSLSKAGAEGLYYCEICGGMFPFAEDMHRTPHPRAAYYYDTEE